VEISGRRGAAQVDRRRVAPVAVAVDDPDRDLAPALVAGRDGVEEGERPEAFLRGAYASESYGPIMAGATLSALPLLLVFLVANRRIVEGVRVSGLKG
jgi:hypothetical protein